jgi:hypothetical protein
MADYTESWRDYRRRRDLLLFAFVAYMPVVALFGFLTIRVFKTTTPTFVAAACWMVFYAVAGIGFQAFKCPRCGRRFFCKWWYNMVARRCVHCGLLKYADAGPS